MGAVSSTWMRRFAALGLAVAAFAMGSLLLSSKPAAAQVEGNCLAGVGGVDARAATTFEHAVEVPWEGTVEVVGRSAQATSSLRIDLAFPISDATVVDERFAEPTTLWLATLHVRDWARYGVGLYQVVATTDSCRVSAWIKVTGRSPFTTVAGLASLASMIAGLALEVAGAVKAARHRGGLVRSILGGVPTGLGALVLSQQFGVTPVTWGWLTLWTAGPAGLGGVVNAAFRGLSRAPTAPPTEARVPTPPSPEIGGDVAVPVPPETMVLESPPVEIPPEHTPIPSPEAPRPPVEVPGDRRDPPRSAYALLDCPEVVVAGQRFDLSVGLSPKPSVSVTGGPMRRPETSVGPYALSVQVVADGFRLIGTGQSWRRELRVTYEAPYPSFVLRVAAEPQLEPVRARSIQAMYSVDGQTMGMAVRSVAVTRSEDLVREAELAPQVPGTDITIPTDQVPADLTVRIIHGQSESDGRLLWTFETPHRDVELPDAPVPSDIGTHPDTFTKKLIEQVALHEGQPGLYQYLVGVGRTVGDQMPDEFWTLLAAVAERAGGHPPMVLILSEEPYVPWELAVLEEPVADGMPPFLAVQANVGRWVLGHRRPKLPPPLGVDVRAMAVVGGVYDRQEWRLVEAEQEAAEIRQAYGAASLDALSGTILDCLMGRPKADLLHFAVHGVYNPEGAKEGLVMLDGQTLDPMEVKGANLAGQPFVFLNACQVGSGNQVLGDYAGMAAAFLYAGAAGVVAPLWSVDDVVAREVALRFYERTLVAGEPPAEFLRSERAKFGDPDHTGSSTYLAYQFFGHPAMKLTRPDGPTS